VPGAQDFFRPAKVAIAPVSGPVASGEVTAGAIYSPNSEQKSSLTVLDAGASFENAIAGALKTAGLVPIVLDSVPAGGFPPKGADYLLAADLKQFTVTKRFGSLETIHGQYFTMHAIVRATVELRDPMGGIVFAGEISGSEDEPPAPVGREVFFPLETDPAESLSVAMSRAAGSLVLEPKFRAAFAAR